MTKLSGLALLLLVAAPASAAVLKARVEGPAGQSAPEELTVRVRPSLVLRGQEEIHREATVSCPVRNGEWTCEVPAAGRVDLRITGAAVMPVYRWDAAVQEGGATDLGTLRLRRGTTVSGWVRIEREGDAVPDHAVQVKLIPLGVPAPRVGLRPNPLPLVTLELGSRPWGFFRFDGLLPGLYVVEASQDGFPLTRLGPVRVQGERPVELPSPLWLRPPASLTVHVDPPPRPGPKGREPWRLKLAPKVGRAGEILVGQVDKDGFWSFPKTAAGDYVLTVSDPSGVTWAVREARLQPGPQSLDLKIRVRTLYGRVTRAGEPLRARLRFIGRQTALQFAATCDEKGIFKAEVPDEGRWKVRVQAPDAPAITLAEPFPPPPQPPPVYPATYEPPEIRISDTWLPVVVVDSQRRPVPYAWVALPEHPENRFQTDASGFCEIRGLEPGTHALLAEEREGRWKGEPVTVDVRDKFKEPLHSLVLPEKMEVAGRIEPRSGTAADALVVARPDGKAPAVTTHTDGDGEFRLILPAGTRNADLWVLAPGSAFRKLRVEIDPQRILQVPVEPVGGTLVLDLPEEVLREARRSKLLDSDLALLCHWADLQGCVPEPSRLVVPNMEPGPYVLTGVPPVLERGEPAADDPRPHGVLAAEGELALRLKA